MGAMRYGNSHHGRGEYRTINGKKCWVMTTGSRPLGDVRNRCGYGYYLTIPDVSIQKKTRRSMCNSGGWVWDVELKTGFLEEDIIKEESEEKDIPDDCEMMEEK